MIVKWDFRKQIPFFPIIAKEMEARGSTWTYPTSLFFLDKRYDNKGGGKKKKSDSRRESNLWEVSFELGLEGLMKCVSSGVN